MVRRMLLEDGMICKVSTTRPAAIDQSRGSSDVPRPVLQTGTPRRLHL